MIYSVVYHVVDGRSTGVAIVYFCRVEFPEEALARRFVLHPVVFLRHERKARRSECYGRARVLLTHQGVGLPVLELMLDGASEAGHIGGDRHIAYALAAEQALQRIAKRAAEYIAFYKRITI